MLFGACRFESCRGYYSHKEHNVEDHTCPKTGKQCDANAVATCDRFWECAFAIVADKSEDCPVNGENGVDNNTGVAV